MTTAAFSQQLNGNFVGMLDWPQLDALWLRVRCEPQGWYASQGGQAVPQTPLSVDALNRFIDEVDALLRREHKYEYCGIVYADNREKPGFIKIYDPHNMGSFCSCSNTPIEPLWVLSRSKPTRLEDDTPLPGARASWWRKPASVLALVTAVAAIVLGGWVYQMQGPSSPSGVHGQAADAAPDVVQWVLQAGKPTIVEFGANNCVSCREMKPVLHALALDPRIVVADVDILKEREYISNYQIRLMPTQVFYDAQGQETSRHLGKISGAEILARLGVDSPEGAAAAQRQ